MKKKSPPPGSNASPLAKQAPKARTVFTDEFKREAVARMRSGQQSGIALALELGIRRNQLYKWAKQLDALQPGHVLKSPGRPPESEEQEIVRLRRELARANEELEILKKFDAYLTRQGK
jgi:transposase